jgi:hypothetical protein
MGFYPREELEKKHKQEKFYERLGFYSNFIPPILQATGVVILEYNFSNNTKDVFSTAVALGLILVTAGIGAGRASTNYSRIRDLEEEVKRLKESKKELEKKIEGER